MDIDSESVKIDALDLKLPHFNPSREKSDRVADAVKTGPSYVLSISFNINVTQSVKRRIKIMQRDIKK